MSIRLESIARGSGDQVTPLTDRVWAFLQASGVADQLSRAPKVFAARMGDTEFHGFTRYPHKGD